MGYCYDYSYGSSEASGTSSCTGPQIGYTIGEYLFVLGEGGGVMGAERWVGGEEAGMLGCSRSAGSIEHDKIDSDEQ